MSATLVRSLVRTVDPEDLFRLEFLQSADLSPAGKTAAFAVSRMDAGADRETAALWLLDIGDGGLRQLTAGSGMDSSPVWSPDGTLIAFLSRRLGTSQIQVIPSNGGEARAVTALPNGVGGRPAWSPDSRRIAFSAPSQSSRRDPLEPYRVSSLLWREDATGLVDDALQNLFVVDVGTGDVNQLTDDGYMNLAPEWSPSGTLILYISSSMKRRWLSRLRLIDLNGEARDLTAEDGHNSAVCFAPDGRVVYVRAFVSGEPAGSKNELWVVDPAGGEPECRTRALPLDVNGILQPDMPTLIPWAGRVFASPDASAAYVRVLDRGTIPIYRVELSGPESCHPVIAGGRACYPLAVRDEQILFAAFDINHPGDLFVAGSDGSNERSLTELNSTTLASLQLPEVERLEVRSGDGTALDAWLLKPPAGQPPFPTVLYIHGGPNIALGEIFSFDMQMLAGAGYAVLFVNHRGSQGYGDEFATALIGDWGNLDYGDLMAAVDLAVERGLADPRRLGVFGFSAGGYLASWIVGQTDRFKAAVAESPLTNFASFYGVSDFGVWFCTDYLGGHPHEIPEVYARCSPITYAHNCTTPTLLIQHEQDWHYPAEQAEQFYTVLKAIGCTTEMLRMPASSHGGSIMGPIGVRRSQNEAVLDWMNRYVKDAGREHPD